jgi:succinyl-diaminopimelate desuccinylase
MSSTPRLDLATDVVTLTAALCDIESVSGDEQQISDAIAAVLRPLGHLEVTRDGRTCWPVIWTPFR